MANQTSDHVKPCNIGSSEAHNKRTPEYLKHIAKENFYIRTDLTPQNSSWVSESLDGKDLTAYYNDIARMVKEKTGRAMQTKERTVVNKKTGRAKIISGSSPLRESVVVCKVDTTIDQLRAYCEHCHQRWGITALQIHIHLDEGHYGIPNDNTTWKPNYHAHIVWDWMNHETGKSYKLGREDMSLMQDMVADCLEMERGTRKEETGKAHLERTDFIIAKQRQEVEQAAQRKERLDNDNRDKEQRSKELDAEIELKQSKANKENGSFLLAKTASLFGKGELSELREENNNLKEEIKKLRGAIVEIKRKFQEEISRLKETIKEAQSEAERQRHIAQEWETIIKQLKEKITSLDKIAHPERYRLSSGAELLRYFIPNYNYPSIHIWTKVGNEEYDTSACIDYFSNIWTRFSKEEATLYELVNEVFEPQEQVNEAQSQLLVSALNLISGGTAQPHVGTSSGGSESDLPWGEKKHTRRR